YFYIIIEAGHNTKALGIAWMSAVLAGFVLMYRKQYAWGFVLSMLFSFMGLMKHPQMSYYLIMLMGVLFCAELYIHIKEKQLKDFAVATLLFVAAVALGAGPQYANIRANNEYVKETMRGGHSELVKASDETNKTAGLDLDYATAWSYGLDETFTLLIPNFKGASSHYQLDENSQLYKTLVSKGIPKRTAADFCQSVPTYWGTQPFTSGPVYVGAIVCFLFVLGLLIVKGPYKWALLVATIFSILLAWGRNFMPFTELFFNYFPMYNKFRTVSSILVVAEITMPILGFLALRNIMAKEVEAKQLKQYLFISAGITAGLCLVFALFGKAMFSFSAPNDAQMFAQLPKWLSLAIVEQRAAMLTADAWRSFIFIALAALLLWVYTQHKLKDAYFVLILGVLVLADMWPVNQRFFNQDNFVTKKENKNYFQMQPYEARILKDQDPHFRVLNLAANTFNDSRTSYYLKSLGGYHAAKLRRYQDLIDEHISKMHMPVINMLNAKYIVVNTSQGPVEQRNPDAFGNAWFVDSVMVVNTPNEECAALNQIDLRTTAVLDHGFASYVKDFQAGADASSQIRLSSYAPDVLEYQSFSKTDRLAVFSEIYYPYGWKAYIDGKAVEHFRVNYTLRALNIPAGNHDIRFEFRPDSVYKNGVISIICAILIYVVLGFLAIRAVVVFKRRR
ncbi:MAG: YfhO family protein, partial [Bacteroidales bacterium]|nr:YfhO family protein [Bacteroidales bacterium]